jgi:hypothetical protein
MTDFSRSSMSFEDGWRLIQDKAINKLTGILEEGISAHTRPFPYHEYVEIYTVAYDMCTQNGARGAPCCSWTGER